MVNFDFKGVRISAIVSMERCTYKDAGGRERTRFDRDVTVAVHFWDYILMYGDLHELAFVKGILTYFMQAYWKRSSKEGSRIDLNKALSRPEFNDDREALCFAAKQKDKKNYLHIWHEKNGETLNQVYLDGHEVIMLDIALGKAINLMSPQLAHHVSEPLRIFR